MRLSDGTVIPCFLGLVGGGVQPDETMLDFALHEGEVQRAIWPGDKDAQAGPKFVTYEVIVKSVGSSDGTQYHYCRVGSLFGGLLRGRR